jgi:hypothetical protein
MQHIRCQINPPGLSGFHAIFMAERGIPAGKLDQYAQLAELDVAPGFFSSSPTNH